MMMMKMRQASWVILTILLLAFVGLIVFEWGMDITGIKRQPNIIGVVNSQKITADQFNALLRQETERQRQSGNELDDLQEKQIRNQVWDALIQQILVDQALKKYNISATNEEVVYTIKNNPPDFLKSQPAFLTNGVFDKAKYDAVLRNPNVDDASLIQIENIIRATLPAEKLRTMLTSSVLVTDEEARYDYMKQNIKARVKFLFFDPNKFSLPRPGTGQTAMEPGESDLKEHYSKNKDLFKEPAQAKLEYVLFSTRPTHQDTLGIIDELKRLADEARNKPDSIFTQLAKEFSEDPTAAKNGGDLGFFGKGMMVKPFEDVAFAAKKGEIAGPFQTPFGFHIVKVIDRKKDKKEEQIHALHILMKIKASSTTLENASGNASSFFEDSKQDDFDKLVASYKLEKKSTPPFNEGTFIPTIGIAEGLNKFAFHTDLKEVSRVFRVNEGYVVARILERHPERIKTFEEVKDQVKSQVINEKHREWARKAAEQAIAEIQAGASFEQAVARDSIEVRETVEFKMDDMVPGVGRDVKFAGAAFGIDKIGSYSKVVEGNRGYFIIQLVDKTIFDENQFNLQKDALKSKLMNQKQQAAFASWFETQKKSAKIEDYRDRFYRD